MKNTKKNSKVYKSNRSKSKPTKRGPLRLLKYLPTLLILAASYNVHGMNILESKSPNRVLSYATTMNVNDLFASTNSQRTSNGVAVLSLNSQLNSAAQSKANDMVTRNYWSHTSPDGQQPWNFIANAGYQYKTAGENLAYGFNSSGDTISGWMNSPAHKDNLLNSAFVDVGFGFANSANFVSDGEQTVIVAMYGAPLSQASPAPVQAATAQPPAPTQPTIKATSKAPVSTEAVAEVIQTVPVATVPEPAVEPVATIATATKPVEVKVAVTSSPIVAYPSQVRRIEIISGNNTMWSISLLVISIGGMAILWVIQRGKQLHRLLRHGERFILNQLHLDLTIASLIILGATLLQTVGVVR